MVEKINRIEERWSHLDERMVHRMDRLDEWMQHIET